MALTRSVLISTPVEFDVVEGVARNGKPFKLQIGQMDVRLSYAELSKLMSDADGEIKDYLGDEHV